MACRNPFVCQVVSDEQYGLDKEEVKKGRNPFVCQVVSDSDKLNQTDLDAIWSQSLRMSGRFRLKKQGVCTANLRRVAIPSYVRSFPINGGGITLQYHSDESQSLRMSGRFR